MRYQVSSKEQDGSSSLLLKAPYMHTGSSYKKSYVSFIVQYVCVVNIVIIIGIFSLIAGCSRAPPDPRDHATAPSPTHTAALAIPGERTGVAAKFSERRFFYVALPDTASNHYTSFLAQR